MSLSESVVPSAPGAWISPSSCDPSQTVRRTKLTAHSPSTPPKSVRRRLEELAASLDGDFDGWEAAVTR